MRKTQIPWFLWPLAALLGILSFLVGLVGRLAAAFLGAVFMVAGGVISFYIVWWLGILMAAAGFLLLVRSMY